MARFEILLSGEESLMAVSQRVKERWNIIAPEMTLASKMDDNVSIRVSCSPLTDDEYITLQVSWSRGLSNDTGFIRQI